MTHITNLYELEAIIKALLAVFKLHLLCLLESLKMEYRRQKILEGNDTNFSGLTSSVSLIH